MKFPQQVNRVIFIATFFSENIGLIEVYSKKNVRKIIKDITRRKLKEISKISTSVKLGNPLFHAVLVNF